MAEVWSSGTWTVKAGQEEAFAAAWREFAEWGLAAYGPARAWLLRDRDQPRVYLSAGPWPSDAAVAAWRADPAFGARITKIRDLVERFEPRTLDPVAAVGE